MEQSGESKRDHGGLIPVVVVDIASGDPLMLAYAGPEELRETAETGLAVFHSRSRGTRWLKGAGSGSTVRVFLVAMDCDRDAAAYIGYTDRHVCHLGRRSCFHNVVSDKRLEELERLLGETWPYTRLMGEGRVAHPLATWAPPPSPLLAALASNVVADSLRSLGVNAVAAPSSPPPLLAGLVAQRLHATLHVAPTRGGAPESIGELDRVAVIAPWPGQAVELASAVETRGARVAAVIAIVRGPDVDGCSIVKVVESGGRLQPLLDRECVAGPGAGRGGRG